MSNRVYFDIHCDSPEEADRVVAYLMARNLSAVDIQRVPCGPPHNPGGILVEKDHVSILAVTATAMCAISACALATFTMLLFPINVVFIGVFSALAYCLLSGPRSSRKRGGFDQLPAGTIQNRGIHVLALVSSRQEIEQLRMDCEQARTSEFASDNS